MNGWLWAATVLAAGLVPLAVVAALLPAIEGIVALELAGTDVTLALLLVAEGTHSQAFADLALIGAATSFVGSVGFVRFLVRLREQSG